MKKFILFIKKYPMWLIITTIINIICLTTNQYNKVFNNNILNFILCEVLILFIYLMIYITKLEKTKT